MNWSGRKWPWPDLRYSPGICLKGVRTAMNPWVRIATPRAEFAPRVSRIQGEWNLLDRDVWHLRLCVLHVRTSDPRVTANFQIIFLFCEVCKRFADARYLLTASLAVCTVSLFQDFKTTSASWHDGLTIKIVVLPVFSSGRKVIPLHSDTMPVVACKLKPWLLFSLAYLACSLCRDSNFNPQSCKQCGAKGNFNSLLFELFRDLECVLWGEANDHNSQVGFHIQYCVMQIKRKVRKVTSPHFGEATVNAFYVPTVRYPQEELCPSLFKS